MVNISVLGFLMLNISVLKWNNVIFKPQTRMKMLNTGESHGILS